MLKKIKDWHNSVEGNHVQCIMAEGTKKLVIRRYGDYEWLAINLSFPFWGVGMIVGRGQSDTDCVRDVEAEIKKVRARMEDRGDR